MHFKEIVKICLKTINKFKVFQIKYLKKTNIKKEIIGILQTLLAKEPKYISFKEVWSTNSAL